MTQNNGEMGQFRVPSRFTLGDFVKALAFLGAIVAAWSRLEASLAELRQAQRFDEEHMRQIEESVNRRLDKISDKLDRLVERERGGR